MAQSKIVRTLFPEPKFLGNQIEYLSDFGTVMKIITSGWGIDNRNEEDVTP